MSAIESDFLNRHRLVERRDRVEDENEVSRDPSRLPVNNLEAYKSWCQRVKDDWDASDE
ncbi:MAG: hypothetical protein HKN49_09975 [Gammaproteobacteria bacterium]|nr:hypothetical protein [Gammaproteobacteria bacterium]